MYKSSKVIVLLILITLVYGLLIKPHNAFAADDINFIDSFASTSASQNLEDYSSNYIKNTGTSAVVHDNLLWWNKIGLLDQGEYLFNVATISANIKSFSFIMTPQTLADSANSQVILDSDSTAGLNSGYVGQVTINDGIYVEGSLFNCYMGSCTLLQDDSTTLPHTTNYLITFKQNGDNTLSLIVNSTAVVNSYKDTSGHQFTSGHVLFSATNQTWGQINVSTSNVAIGQTNPFCATFDLICNIKNIFIPNSQYDSALFAAVQNNINNHVPFAYVNAALNLDFSQSHAATSSVAMTIPMLDNTASTSGQMYHPRILGVATTAIHWEMPATTKHNIALFSYPIFIILFVIFFIDFIVICVHIMLK